MVSAAQRDLLLSAGIPLTSFGGIPVAIALYNAGLIADPGTFAWGCVIGSALLAYLAYVKPRRDIVSLCAPLYAVLIFVVPMEMQPNLLTQTPLRGQHHDPDDTREQVVLKKDGRCQSGSSRVRLEARLPVLRQTVEAVDGASLRRLEGDLAFFSTVRTDRLGHLSRAAATIVPGTATRRPAIPSVIHLGYSHRLLCRISCANCVNNLSP